ncbi:ABC transporter permease [Patulibacter sp. SYSU D01012]|uniref:ABC transporter permease n=1 Tax=Patulibacter sp. SYSU D01012 TaxID=2817381 RepID=UPI001B3148EF|nr:ABC transporter permease [Patulibacter sp. SYSU D01012]
MTGRRLLGRLAAGLATVLVASVVVFAALNATTGDPVPLYAANADLTPAAQARLRAELHLDDPLPVRYLDWLGGLAHGDLGRSVQFRQDVGGLVAERLPTTLLLVAMAAVLAVGLGVGLGLLAGLRPGPVDRLVVAASSAAVAVPTFVAATALVAALAVGLGWFPVFGDGEGLPDRLWHLALPACALALHVVGIVARVSRAAVRRSAAAEHVRIARWRGVPERRVVRDHVLRGALGAVVTVSGVEVAAMLAGTVIVETAFGLSGVGSLLVQAVEAKDAPIVQAVVLVVVTGFVLVTLVTDLLQARLDPRAWRGTGARA